jgi:phosphate butyryltransferase
LRGENINQAGNSAVEMTMQYYENFDMLIEKARAERKMVPMAVACAEEEHTLEAVIRAWREQIVSPRLVGDKGKILDMLKGLDERVPEEQIIESPDKAASAFKVVQLVREGKASFLMKGLIDTGVMLRAFLNRESGLASGQFASQMSVTSLPGFPRLFAITDVALNISPSLEQKKAIIQNAVNGMRALGYDRPKVAVVTANENVDPKMPESVDAGELKKMWLAGEIPDCDLEGPISMDLALNSEVAAIKGFGGPVAGRADILVMPHLVTANILSKALREFADSTLVGVVLGARVPMVLTSRGASLRTKYTSVVVVAQMAGGAAF